MAAKKGLTLIEVLVSVVILATGAVAVTQALMRVSHAMSVAEFRTLSTQFAASKMAEVEMLVAQGEEVRPGQGRTGFGLRSFEWTLDVSETHLLDSNRLGLITLDLVWKRGSASYRQKYQTLLPVFQKENG
ncbi:MAG: prepilin-type N-terminal cleavage/methylation domain-containing protein [Candidatus Omnitrophica bacterium]|nr:prepilin-type N-terminal cleavage/methylation domain-containing protein [Candidatus Omnitrophota bacterium]